MKISEVSKVLFKGITPAFEVHNFKLDKRKRQYRRGIDDITQIVDLRFFKHPSYIKIRPEVHIKIKPIEDIYRSATSEQFRFRPLYTLGNHLFEILRYVDKGEETGKENIYDWSIEDVEDIKKLIEVIPEYLEETILPYFKENSSVARVDYLLNKYPRELSVHNYMYPERANIAIIAARLNNNPRYAELVTIYEEELQEAAEDYQEEFYALKKLLGRGHFSSEHLRER